MKGLPSLINSIPNQGPFSTQKRLSGFLISHIFSNEKENVYSVPNTGWIVDKIFKASDESIEAEDIPSYSLARKEIRKITGSLGCRPDAMTVRTARTILTPEPEFKFPLTDGKELPEVLLFPLQSGLDVTFACGSDTKAEFSCIPSLDGNDSNMDLTCSYTSGQMQQRVQSRSRRRVPSAAEKNLEDVQKVFGDAFGVWKDMVPSVLSCTGAVAGCDFCLYFFTTYNISAHPNVCIGGCALGTVGSCTSLIGTSLVKSMELVKNEE